MLDHQLRTFRKASSAVGQTFDERRLSPSKTVTAG